MAFWAHANTARTAIRTYGDEAEWLGTDTGKGVAGTLCCFGAIRDGAIVCASVGEQQQLLDLVRGLIEGLDIGLGLPQVEPEVLTIEQLKGRRFREVFVSQGIDPASTPMGDMLRVFGAARVGLHLIQLAPKI
jgi:hypothetical protein